MRSRVVPTRWGAVLGTLLAALSFAAGGCSKKSSTQPPPGGGGGGSGASFNSGSFSSGVFVYTFPNAGTFGYRCTVHGSAMSGAVEVDASNPQDSAVVTISNNFFNPALAEIRPGGYVKWIAGGSNHGVRSN